MLKALFERQREFLNAFFDALDTQKAEAVLNRLLECKGSVVFSGVGKSGHIAEKISATFISIGVKAFYLSSGNALHGDIGFISKGDLFICFSKSGSSQELIDLIPYIQKKGAFTIAVVSTPHSPLARLADDSIILPVHREICPYNLTPTTSAAVQLIFGDCLAVALMQAKKLSVSEFAENHPGGLLGRKITTKIHDLMLKGEEIPLCKPTDLLIDCLHELSIKRCGCLLIANDQNELEGIFTDGDLRRAIQSKGPDALRLPMNQLMTRAAKSISPDLLIQSAVQKMEEDPSRLITVLPVLIEKRIVGLIRMHDILQKGFS